MYWFWGIGHFIKDIDAGSPAAKADLKDGDILVAVNGESVEALDHDGVVQRIKKCGEKTTLLIVNKETDDMYKLVRKCRRRVLHGFICQYIKSWGERDGPLKQWFHANGGTFLNKSCFIQTLLKYSLWPEATQAGHRAWGKSAHMGPRTCSRPWTFRSCHWQWQGVASDWTQSHHCSAPLCGAPQSTGPRAVTAIRPPLGTALLMAEVCN